MLDDAAVDDSQHVEYVYSETPTARCVTHVQAVVRSGSDVASPDRVAGDDQVLDLELEVGKRAS